jgi:hypothetical protein
MARIVKSFRELDTYQKARESAAHIFQITKNFPLDERYSRTQFQSRDSTWQSIGAMINGMINRADDFCKLAPDANHRITINGQ